MARRTTQEILISRLRAHGLIPDGFFYIDRRSHSPYAKLVRISWVVRDTWTGEELPVGSSRPMELMARTPRWKTQRVLGGFTFVEPEDDNDAMAAEKKERQGRQRP